MKQTANSLISLREQLEKWEKEYNRKGYIDQVGDLLSSIGMFDEAGDKAILSDMLALAALSREKKRTHDSLVFAWMEKALELNPDNQRAAFYLAKYEWKNKKDLLATLTFPPIRETDNRPAKKKTAEQYIDICRQFLSEAEEQLELLQKRAKSAGDFENVEIKKTYGNLSELLLEAIEEAGALLKAAQEYEQSITGVFYTSTHYQNVKIRLEQLEEIKARWNRHFEGEEQNEQKKKSPLDELHEMIGLSAVKTRVNNFYRFLKYQRERKALGFQSKDELSLNMVLTGNPGTGKTTLARLFAKIYHELGVLPREEVIEADRSRLVGAFVGQTEENVRSVVEQALGGVLFIDEAYSLKRKGQTGNDYGQTAVDTLVSLMTGTEYGGKFAVILAGYPEEMRQFLDTNPGLRSRFPQSNHLHLPDYSNHELLEIGEQLALDNDYVLTEDARLELENRLENERVDDTFGNARTVRNIILDAIFKKGSESGRENHFLDYTLLGKHDFKVEELQADSSPAEKLEALIGLKTVKEEVKSLVSFVKMQQLRRERGLPLVPIQLHSVFTGNPGTGKTTVAKIYAELLKECGMLKRGHVIIASRADLVASFVGQTAVKTKKKIREALGGVLFIDEAYSLLGQSPGDFGKEAIDTLVDEMTKHNENLVVVLAGYPQEMELLLESNPGLRSRFKKFLYFPDYTTGELLQIMESYSRHYQYQLTDEAKKYITEAATKNVFAGNGRLATNIIDEAIQAQAMRLITDFHGEMDLEKAISIEKDDLAAALTKMRRAE